MASNGDIIHSSTLWLNEIKMSSFKLEHLLKKQNYLGEYCSFIKTIFAFLMEIAEIAH